MTTQVSTTKFWQVGGAAVIVGLAGYLVLLLAAPSLGPADYSTFAIFWSVLYFITGTLFGAQQEITRSVRAAAIAPRPDNTRVIKIGAIIAIAIFAIVLGTSWGWGDLLFGADSLSITLCILAGTVLYSAFAILAGSLAGRGEWAAYSWLMVADAVVRLALVMVVIFISATLVGLAIATVSAMAVGIFALFGRRSRLAFMAFGDAPLRPAIARAASSVVATASTAALVTGFAAMIKFAVPEAPAEELGVIILVVTLTRAPILMPINAYLGLAVASFYDGRAEGIKVIVKPGLLIVGVGLGLSAAAALLGPWLIQVLFGPAFYASGSVIGLATVAATLIGLLSLTGAAALAFGRHRGYVMGWIASAGSAILLLTVPVGLTERVLLALLVSPLVGTVIHILSVARGAVKAVEPTNSVRPL